MGKVTLVGAGPGDSKLLTIKAKEAILNADLVLYDRLVGIGIMAMIPINAEIINVGKTPLNHPVPQEEINQLMLDHAQAGKNVVRLKGGDPYLFGRGAEELEEIVKAGIDFEVIPGITSALAVPSYAGIPVTHRDYSSSLHIVTAHGKRNEKLNHDFESLVKLGGTLVFMMGVSELENICEQLINAGMPSDMPAALVEKGTTSKQKSLVATVANISQQARANFFGPPSVFVVGKVCSLAKELNWVKSKPLASTSVLVTRPQGGASKLSATLRALGCSVVEVPTIELELAKMDHETAQSIKDYDWLVFTSKVGVESFTKNLAENSVDIRHIGNVKIAAVGKETANAINERGMLVDYIPEIFDGDHLGLGLSKHLKPGQKVLLYRSALGRDKLPELLKESGATITDLVAYHTDYENKPRSWVTDAFSAGEIDYVAFTSGSTVEGFVQLAGKIDLSKVIGICIGDQTAKAAKKYGMVVEQSEYTSTNSMVDKIMELVEVNK